MTVAHAQALRLRCFLEGIEVPIIAIQTQSAPNSPTVATLQIPPLAEATRLMPRTTVHVFFLDIYKQSPALLLTGSSSASQKGDNPNVPAQEDEPIIPGTSEENIANSQLNAANSQWKLLFGGETVGFTWTKTPFNRSIILQCEDWSNYWDTAYQADNTSIFGPGLKAVFSGASTNLFTDMLFPGQSHIITQIVSQGRCNTYPNMKGLAAGIIRLIEVVGGSYYVFPGGDRKQAPKRVAGQNIFFSYNELRLHLTQLVGSLESDPTSERLLRVQGYTGLFNRALGGQGGMTSIRKAMTSLSNIIFYEMYPQPCPKYRAGSFESPTGTRRVSVADHPQFGQFYTEAVNDAEALEFLVDDVLNLRESLTEDNREEVRQKTLLVFENTRELQKQLLQARGRMAGVPEPMPSKFSQAATRMGKALTFLQQAAAGRVEALEDAAGELNEGLAALQEASETTALLGTAGERRPAQLFQHIFRPDIWFGSPPRCNVIFPELYEQMSYQRSFMQEPTRFMLKTNDELLGENMFTDKYYFSPKGYTTAQDRLRWTTILKRGLLLHERFTGILPVFEKMGEFNVFASSAQGEAREGIGKTGLAQRTANFLYFRHRFNARRMTLNGKFNPYVAIGFPALIMDRWVDAESLARHAALREQISEVRGLDVPTIDSSAALGTNFLGNFTQVVHQVSNPQKIGTTSYTVTFPRQPEENVEFLGTVPEDERINRRLDGADARRSIVVASLFPPALFSIGPNGGKVINVVDRTFEYSGRDLPYFDGSDRKTTQWKQADVTVGVATTARETGSGNVRDAVDDVDAPIVFGAYELTEEIPRYQREDTVLPAEEYIRPGWYGNVWSNQQIGKAYQHLLSTGAITDAQIVQDYGRTDAQLHSEPSLLAEAAREDVESEDDPRADAAKLPSLDAGASIQDAVEYLTTLYSYIKRANIDVDEFIGAYTWRPVASMLDMFGTADLEYSENGEQVLSGTEGFHSRAFGPYQNLFGLVDAEINTILGIKRDDTAAVLVDTRQEKREMVERYVASLLFSTAILG